jgi:hypothetical protein
MAVKQLCISVDAAEDQIHSRLNVPLLDMSPARNVEEDSVGPC